MKWYVLLVVSLVVLLSCGSLAIAVSYGPVMFTDWRNAIAPASRQTQVDPIVVSDFTPRIATENPTQDTTVEAPQAENSNIVSLRYDNAGCVTNTGLAPGQTKTVAWLICNSTTPVEAWTRIQEQAQLVGAFTYTADPGTEMTIELPLGTAWVTWNSTCPNDPLKVDVSRPSQDLTGPGCIRFMPEYGGGDRALRFEQAVAVH